MLFGLTGIDDQRKLNRPQSAPACSFLRYACYLIAQNGDPKKEQIAFAQSYLKIEPPILSFVTRRKLSLVYNDKTKLIVIRNEPNKVFETICNLKVVKPFIRKEKFLYL